MTQNEKYMQRALELAALAKGRTSPNPMVGAVLVKAGQMVGEGWHEKAGGSHAEIVALKQAGSNAQGADIYVTLEPCSHHGRTGPCADALIEAGVKKVFVAVRDPNPLVAGQGIAKLQAAGIAVEEGLLEEQAVQLNEVFFKWIKSKQPFVVAKYAMTLDGKIATKTGDSKWITNAKSRAFAHSLRNDYDVILVGVGTVIADDPELTCRIQHGRNPVRVVLDSRARIPLESQLLHDGAARTIIVTTQLAPKEKLEKLAQAQVEILQLPDCNGHVDVSKLMEHLGADNLTSVLVEGGGEIHAAMFASALVDKVYAFVAPKIIGGREAPGPVCGSGRDEMAEAIKLERIEVKKFADDILLSAYVRRENS